jgi:hypothetical protein
MNGSKPNGDILMEITMPSKKEVWVTTDGQQFDDLKDAEYYELRSTVAEHFNPWKTMHFGVTTIKYLGMILWTS